MKRINLKRICLGLALSLSITAFSGVSMADKKDIKTKTGIERTDEKVNEDRITGLILGTDGGRTDTIMLATYNEKSDKLDIVSIPRDTFIKYKKPGAEFKKINSVYQIDGFEGLADKVKEVIGQKDLKIDKYILLDYKGVKTIVNAVGGINVDVPPEIANNTSSLSSGNQLLKGDRVIDYLRHRKSFSNGDLGRVYNQQDFVKEFLKQANKNKISAIKSVLTEVNTNLGLKDSIYYGYKISNIDKDDIKFHTLPGHAESRTIEGQTLSYYINDKKASKDMMNKILK